MGGGRNLPAVRYSHAADTPEQENNHLWGIVDMGSNGIRFSISDLSLPTARVIPTVYTYRNGISLYEAQYDDDGNQIPIPDDIIDSVIAALLRFQIFCMDFKVPFDHIRVLATEATRTALNSYEFRMRVLQESGLRIEMLSKSEEGAVGAYGIASSFPQMSGLVMDLGGGSTQITWLSTKQGKVKTSRKGAMSFPYGAAALTKRLKKLTEGKSEHEAEVARQKLREEMRQNFLQAYQQLEIPDDMVEQAKLQGGFPLYLSGGGFRGWGYLLLHLKQSHHHHYPISIINGFKAQKEDFEDTEQLKRIAKEADKIFRVSDRRRSQVPAVAFLVNVLARSIPYGILEAHFCQGGVREGVLYQMLPCNVRSEHPLVVATAPYAKDLAPKLAVLLQNALPSSRESLLSPSSDSSPRQTVPESINTNVIQAMANMIYVHADMHKEVSSTAALYSTSTGQLSSTHGILHSSRALLALLLEARYKGDLPPREYKFRESLRSLLTPEEVWWTQYLGAVAFVLSRIYPAGCSKDCEACGLESKSESDTSSGPGLCPRPVANTSGYAHAAFVFAHKKPHLSIKACWSDTLGKYGDKEGVELTFTLRPRTRYVDDPMKVEEDLRDHVKKIHKVGKHKHWIGGEDGFGWKVAVKVETVRP